MKNMLVSFAFVVVAAMFGGCSSVPQSINPRIVYGIGQDNRAAIVQTIAPKVPEGGWKVEGLRLHLIKSYPQSVREIEHAYRIYASNGTIEAMLEFDPDRRQPQEGKMKLPRHQGWFGTYKSKLCPRPEWVEDINEIESWQPLPEELSDLMKYLSSPFGLSNSPTITEVKMQ